MKKSYLYLVVLAVLIVVFSCEKEYEIPVSSTSAFDGDWQIRYDYQPELYGEDALGLGYSKGLIYNIASDNGDSIWLDVHLPAADNWDFKVKVPVSKNGVNFGSNDTILDEGSGYRLIVKNGKIIKDAVKMPSGLVVDSIYYELWHDDIFSTYAIDTLDILVGGVRHTGFSEDIR